MADTNEQRWQGHPAFAAAVRVAIFVVPFITAMIVAFTLSNQLPLAETTTMRIVRWLGIIVASTAAMTVIDRLARRLLPLSTLLKLTLLFPDQAPSRFRIAMRTGTTNQLRKKLDDARTVRLDETPSESAERLLELVGLLSQHDRLTRGHSERVRAYTHLIGEEMGLTEIELDKIRWAGLLHDVGKTAISPDILNKPGRLTDAEYETIKSHPMEGRALVEPLADWLGDSLRAVWEHHERFDGNGYPHGLAGTEISIAARIVTVADCYDVMTSARSYKKPMSATAARAELAACSGTQFDPVVVRSFLNVSLGRLRLMNGPLAWFAQLALFEPSGVVHAASTAGSGASGTGATTAASAATATGTASGAAAVGTSTAVAASSSGVLSTAAAVTVSVAASTAGMAAAAPPTQDLVAFGAPPVVTMVEAVAPLDAPETTVIELGSGDVVLAEALAAAPSDDATDDFGAADPASPAPSAGAGSAGAPVSSTSVPADDPDPTSPTGGATAGSDGNTQSTIAPSTTAPGRTTTTTSGETSATTVPRSTPTTAPRSTTPTTTPSSTIPPAPTTTTPSSVTSTTQPATTTTTVSPTTTTTTTTTVPPTTTTVPPTTTTTTTTTTVPQVGGDGDRVYLGGDVLTDTAALAYHALRTAAPPNIALPNFDTDRDDHPGALVQKDSAGISGSDPTKVLEFTASLLSPRSIDGDLHIELYAAAKDFARNDITIEAGLYHCPLVGSCVLLGSDDIEFKNADKFKKKKFHLHGVDTTVGFGSRLEVRIAVLDDSEDDAWIAFGTSDYGSHVKFPKD